MTIRKSSSEALNYINQLTGEAITFGGMLANIRQCDEISQVTFAKMLGVSRQYLCDIEHNRKLVSPKSAYEYAKKLGYSTKYFVWLALQSAIDNAGLEFNIQLEDKGLKLIGGAKHQKVGV
jgi:transcriptional regulator with XRE-family HTH domain